MMFREIYQNLCESNMGKRYEWIKRTGNIHRHHIVPVHAGGKSKESNHTYLTTRQHQIAHYLLYKMHGSINDLRSMHMLGAHLTKLQRYKVGCWCRDNKIGFFSDKFTDADRAKWEEKKRVGWKKQREQQIGIFDPSFMSEHGKLAGMVGGKRSFEKRSGFHSQKYKQSDKAKKARISGGITAGHKMKGIKNWTDGTVNKRSFTRPGDNFYQGYTVFTDKKYQWYSDGKQNKLCERGQGPSGWKVGRLYTGKTTSGYRNWTDGVNNTKSGSCPGVGWRIGFTRHNNVAKTWYNNESKQRMFVRGQQPDGWSVGMIKRVTSSTSP